MTTGSIAKKRENEKVKKLIICHIVGFLFVNVFAGLAGEMARTFPDIITRIFLPINLSLGQQLKLMIVPLTIVFIVEYLIVGKDIDDFIPVHLMISGYVPIATLGIYHIHYYTLHSPLSTDGPHIVLALALYIAAFLGSILLITSKKDYRKRTIPALIVYLALCITILVASFTPVRIETFYDQINEVFGLIY